MKEQPILFNGPMVRAILEGRKTQTRRVVKPEPTHIEWFEHQKGWIGSFGKDAGSRNNPHRMVPCPYGSVGDQLWVRETHYVESAGNHDGTGRFVLYRATDADASISKWTPSIYMPRWASRITLKITEVKVERLWAINNEDCVAEGISANGKAVKLSNGSYAQAGLYEGRASTVRQLFSELWTQINGPESWDANPWVWVVSFKSSEASE